jgi:hypothetical protein
MLSMLYSSSFEADLEAGHVLLSIFSSATGGLIDLAQYREALSATTSRAVKGISDLPIDEKLTLLRNAVIGNPESVSLRRRFSKELRLAVLNSEDNYSAVPLLLELLSLLENPSFCYIRLKKSAIQSRLTVPIIEGLFDRGINRGHEKFISDLTGILERQMKVDSTKGDYSLLFRTLRLVQRYPMLGHLLQALEQSAVKQTRALLKKRLASGNFDVKDVVSVISVRKETDVSTLRLLCRMTYKSQDYLGVFALSRYFRLFEVSDAECERLGMLSLRKLGIT